MAELELVGLDEDGEHLVLTGPDGVRHSLRITEALRAAVRRDRPQLEYLQAERRGFLPPREIQSQIRAGRTAEEVAELAGLSVEQVRRYEGPVLAEREFVVGLARASRLGRDPGAPSLGDLVADRLATRGVPVSELTWDAARRDTEPWTVSVTFTVGGGTRSARWAFDQQARSLSALEDEARWLSETELGDEPIPRRHLNAVRAAPADAVPGPRDATAAETATVPAWIGSVHVEEPAPAPATPEPAEGTSPGGDTDALLEDLRGRRGVRGQAPAAEEPQDAEPSDDGFEGFGPQRAFDFSTPGNTVDAEGVPDGAAGRGGTVHALRRIGTDAPEEAVVPAQDATHTGTPGIGAQEPEPREDAPSSGPDAEDAPAQAEPPAQVERTRSGRRARSKVPSWDEIVFGAKPE